MQSLKPDVPLPMSRDEMRDWWGWEELDVLLVNGDAYVDHPSFGIALIGRVLVDAGFRTGIVAQPQNDEDFLVMGRPRLFVGVSAGNIDSMLNHFTAARKPRSQDHYSPGGVAGLRPDRATMVYTNTVRRLLKGVPVVIGGVEASLRRLAHWDHWSNTIRRSLLVDAKADLLCYGMAEQQVLEVAHRLRGGEGIRQLCDVRGTCWWTSDRAQVRDVWNRGIVETPAFSAIVTDRAAFAEAEKIHFHEQDPQSGKVLVQATDNRFVVQNPPARPLEEAELDRIYDLPFTRREHPVYAAGVPALETVRTSIVTHRGCIANCNFCSIVYHQGKDIQNRSADSVVREAQRIAADPAFHGTIADVGGPSANMYGGHCAKMRKLGSCTHRDCLLPEPCPSFKSGLNRNLDVLRRIRALPGVKHAFIQSGIRYDLALRDGDAYLDEVARHHVSGIMKVAPESTDDRVLALMNKPRFDVYQRFKKAIARSFAKAGKRQFVTEYIIAGHPGSTLASMVETACTLHREGMQPDQVQEFIPLPMTLSTAMYVTGLHPLTGEPVAVARGDRERRQQKALVHAGKPENRALVEEALRETQRLDAASLLFRDGGHRAQRGGGGSGFGPAYLAGDALDHDGHFPVSWGGRKKTSTIKPLSARR
jgi:uncharacterized radical SAM protein YgiQ